MPSIKLYNNLDQSTVDITIPCQFGRETGEVTFPEDDSVSTLHGEILLNDSSIFILDLGSTNGTYVNDHRLEPNKKVLIQDDDLVEFGEQSFHVGVSKDFNPENVHERYQQKKTERLREMLNASKTEKLQSILSKEKTLNQKKKQIQEQLNQIKEKYKKGKTAEKSLHEKKSIIDKNIANFPDIKAKKSLEFDQVKKTLFQQKTDLDDKIKLLNISGDAEDSQLQKLSKSLEEIKVKIDAISEEKKNFPKKINQLKKNQQIMEKTILETASKLRKVEHIISENEKKYLPILDKIEIQLAQLKRERDKLNDGTISTKTRQL